MLNNYQLYKTNVLLGGQMKWNISVASMGTDMYINDFYLSPISDLIVFSRPDRDVLNYSHSENIKDLYDSIRSNFFNTEFEQSNSKYPIILQKNEYKDTYCSIYDAGVKRNKCSLYDKSISLFCPLWLEDFNCLDTLEFIIEAYIKQNDERTVVIEKRLKFSNIINKEYHNKFLQYFYNYIRDISGEEKIGENVININFKNNYAAVEGIDTNTGKVRIKNVSNQLPNLIYRLRPMMDTDNILINMLSDNSLICKQLFNFNFIFDFEDIIPYNIRKQLKGESIYFDTHIKHTSGNSTRLLERKSFNYNYSENFNVGGKYPLSYFEDYNCLDLIDKNKLVPNIIHWSLIDSNDYIFNIYPKMYNEVNLWVDDVSLDENCLLWCNGIDVSTDENIKTESDLQLFISNLSFDEFTKFSNENCIVNNIKYTKLNELNNPIYLYWIIVDNNVYNNDDIRIIEKEEHTNYFVLITNKRNENLLSFKKFQEQIEQITEIDNIDLLTNYVESTIIRVDNSIYKSISNSPLNGSKELTYKKCSIPGTYIFRYFGKIKPNFIDYEYNNNYEIRKITQSEYNKSWDSYIKTGYQPLYPSINYFYINSVNKGGGFEPKWYFDSIVLLLDRTIKFEEEVNIPINEHNIDIINKIIKPKIETYYNIKRNNNLVNYIYSLYDVTYNYDYDVNNENTTEFNYKYIIKLSLK